MYIYDYEDLLATAKTLNMDVEALVRENWEFDGIHGYNQDKERWVSPSGDYVLLDVKETV